MTTVITGLGLEVLFFSQPDLSLLVNIMRQDILRIARSKFSKLSQQYDGFVNVIVDDWRGFRFVFDTTELRRGKIDCPGLYQLLKNEPVGLFSAGLYPASVEDKRIYGPQKFLNCKTLKQYRCCYVNFLIKKAQTKKEIEDELNLIKNLKIIYSKYNNEAKLETKFKKSIISQALLRAQPAKKKIIKNIAAKMKF